MTRKLLSFSIPALWLNRIISKAEPKQHQHPFSTCQASSPFGLRTQSDTERSTFATLGSLTHATLSYGAGFLEFAPVPGLAGAARSIARIWDALDDVHLSRTACERLAELCEELMHDVSGELARVEGIVDEELLQPLQTLDESCKEVLTLLEKIARLSMMDRFLRKDEIERDIEDLHKRLRHYIDRFDRVVRIRNFMRTQDIYRETQDIRTMLFLLLAHQPPQYNIGPSMLPCIHCVQEDILRVLEFPSRYALSRAAQGSQLPVEVLPQTMTTRENLFGKLEL